MPYGFDTKPLFQRLLRPATRVAAAAGVTANQVTTATIVLSLAAGTIVALRPDARWPLLLVPCVLVVRVAFNHIDGMLACEHGMKTPLGAILNEIADVVSDAALYLPLAAVPGVSAWLVVPAVVLGLISEMTGVVAIRIGAERREDGPLAKKPRGLVFGAAALALGLGAAPGPWLDVVLAATLLLLLLTIANRVDHALKQASHTCSPV
jgi:CDP-diacylglycerol--glycerol-3-phosphate 3-phosphatidyltransferase